MFSLSSRSLFIIATLLASVAELPARAQLSPFYQWQNARPTGANITDIAAINDSTAFALQKYENIGLRTTDRGLTWQRISLGSAIGDILAERVSFAGDSLGLIGQNYVDIPVFGRPPRKRATLMRTTNGGRTWQALTSIRLPLGSGVVDVQLVTRQVGYVLYVVAGGSFLIRTTDSGLTWGAPVSFSMPGFFGRVTDMCFASATTGWVTAGPEFSVYTGCMLKTIDGGQTWQRQTLRGDSTIEHQQVVFADAQHGWLITREPIVNGRSYWQYRTTNGGRTWQPMVGIENIDFIAAASAQRVATHFAYSTNGGLTWQTNTTRPIYSGRFVLRPSGAGFHVIGPQRTTDFGATWTGRTAAFEGDISPVTPFDARRAWVGAAGGAGVSAARTLDRGAHWEVSKLHEIATDSLGWVLSGPGGAWAFPDLDTAYMATAHGTPAAPFPYHSDIMRTADGGRTWQPQLLPPGTPPLWALAFYNSRHGCGVGDSGAIVLTHDGGQTWQRIANDSTRRLVAVSWASPTLLLAIAIANDNAIRPSDLMRSTDGGRTWTHQANIYAQYGPISWRTPTEPWLPGYLNQTQVVAGRSTDGGLTWQPFIPVPTPAISTNELLRGFYGVTFSDSLHGWYRDRRPIYTADGGLTWRAMSDSYALPALSQYVDRYNGWLFGGYTTIPGGLLHYSEKYIQADTSLARRTYCAGDTLLLRYTRTGTFGATEQAMVAEISNAQGRFGQYPPVVGQGTASPLRVVLPATLAPGTGYLVRVARADHSVIGGDNQQPLAIYRRPAATVSPAGPLVVCAGDSLRLTAPAGFGQYKWSTGDTTATLYVAQAGTYAVQVATGGGCFGAASPPVVVSVTPRPASPVIAVQQGAAGALAVLSTSTVAAGYQWLLNGVPVGTGATYAVSTAAQSGSYTLVVTQNGCASGPSGPQTVVVLGAIGDVTTGALSVYPNPTKDQVIVRSVGAAVADVTLTDQAGRVVARTAGAAAPETVLLLAGVPAGSYLLRVRFRDGRQTTRSLLVQP